MPTLPQGELPRPKSWDEFEDIVWDLYSRLWDDPNAQRYGRSGQAQQGVDIYGRPSRLDGRYVGIQCKRWDAGTLTRKKIEAEIAKAETFVPPLGEYLIATTGPRDAKLQEDVRKIDAVRRAAGKFPVDIVFWDDLCSHLTKRANHDLLQKHYGDWLAGGLGPRLGAPFQAPPLPPHFVPRPEVSDAVKARLLAEQGDIPGVLVVSAIQGLGGIGKSVMAAALAHDKEVRSHFGDGILWVTLGQQPSLLPILSDWVQILGDHSFGPTTVEAASARLRTLLQDRAVLLVLDDAWDPAHVQPFLGGGSPCRVLITTRETLVTHLVGATAYNLDVMTRTQALDLLASRLGRALMKQEQQRAMTLAETVGHLPLALELAAAQLAAGVSWADLLQDLQAEIARLETLDMPGVEEIADEAIQKRLSLLASFNLSLRRLPRSRYEAFAWLGVLAEDVLLFSGMAATIWATEKRVAQETLHYLQSKALLQASGSLPDGSLAYRLHDLLHDLARRTLTSPPSPTREGDLPGLGMSLEQAHTVFLERCRKDTQAGCWHTLVDDGYLHTHLTWHMKQAGLEDEIHRLLREETPEGVNGWYRTRDQAGQTAGYLADVGRAWQLAEKAHSIDLQCRYAFIVASLNSLAANLPPNLLSALIEDKLWTPAQGLAYAQQVPDPGRRASALMAVAPYLDSEAQEPVLRQAMDIVQKTEGEEARVQALTHLVRRFAENKYSKDVVCAMRKILIEGERTRDPGQLALWLVDLGYPEEAIVIAQEVQGKTTYVVGQVELGKKLVESGYLEEASRVIQGIPFEQTRSEIMALLASRLAKLGRFEEALATAQNIEEETARKKTLQELAYDFTRSGHTEEALSAVQEIPSEAERTEILRSLIRLSVMGRSHRQALTLTQRIEDRRVQVELLARLFDLFLRTDNRDETLAAMRAFEPAQVRFEAWQHLVTDLPTDSQDAAWQEMLTAAREIEDHEARTKALVDAARLFVDSGRAEEALAVARATEEAAARSRMLEYLASEFPVESREEILEDTLAAAREVKPADSRFEMLSSLVASLPADLQVTALQEMVVAARGIEDYETRTKALVHAARLFVESGRVEEALAVARASEEAAARFRMLEYLAHAFPVESREEILADTLAAARQVEPADSRFEMLSNLVAGLPANLQVTALQDMVVAARGIEDYETRTKALVGTARLFVESGCAEEALAVTRATEEAAARFIMLEYLASVFPMESREEILEDTLAAAREVEPADSRFEMLSSLVKGMPVELRVVALQEMVVAARGIEDYEARTKALTTTVQQFIKLGCEQEALEAAQLIEDEARRNSALVETVLVGLPRSFLPDLGADGADTMAAVDAPAYSIRSFVPGPAGGAFRIEHVLQAPVDRGHPRMEHRWQLDPSQYRYQSMIAPPEKLYEACLNVEDAKMRAASLIELVPCMRSELRAEALQEAVTAASKILHALTRDSLIVYCVSQLALMGDLDGVLTAIDAISDKRIQTAAISVSACHLAQSGYAEEALTTARSISDHWSRIDTQALLSSHLPEPMRKEVLTDALRTTQVIGDDDERRGLLIGATCHLQGPVLSEVMNAWSTIKLNITNVTVVERDLLALLSRLEAPSQVESVLQIIRSLPDVGKWYRVVGRAASRFAELGHPRQALALARELPLRVGPGIMPRIEALAELASYAPKREKREILQEAIALARTLPKEDQTGVSSRLRALVNLLPRLSPPLYNQALEDAWEVTQSLPKWDPKGRSPRARAIIDLVPHMSETTLRTDVAAAWDLLEGNETECYSHEEALAAVKAGLLPYLPETFAAEILQHMLKVAGEVGSSKERTRLLIAITPYLPQSLQARALDLARLIQSKWRRAEVLTLLACHLSGAIKEQVLREALSTAQNIENNWRQARALRVLISQVPPALGKQVLKDALDAARSIESGWRRAHALADLIPFLSPPRDEILREILVAATAIEEASKRAEVILDSLQYLSEPLQQEAMTLVRELENDQVRSQALVGFALQIAKSGRAAQALAVIGEIDGDATRSASLAKLVPHLPIDLQDSTLQEALTLTNAIREAEDRAQVMTKLAPLLTTCSPAMANSLLEETIRTSARRTRRDLIMDIQALLPLFAAVADERSVAGIFYVVQDVGRWWP